MLKFYHKTLKEAIFHTTVVFSLFWCRNQTPQKTHLVFVHYFLTIVTKQGFVRFLICAIKPYCLHMSFYAVRSDQFVSGHFCFWYQLPLHFNRYFFIHLYAKSKNSGYSRPWLYPEPGNYTLSSWSLSTNSTRIPAPYLGRMKLTMMPQAPGTAASSSIFSPFSSYSLRTASTSSTCRAM